jgi:cytoplasmic FMR1 interacting protein
MQITPFTLVRRSKHYDAAKWPLSHVEAEVCYVNVIERLRRARDDHTDYVTHLARLHNDVSYYYLFIYIIY